MPIQLTNLHKSRVVDQIQQNLVGLQADMRRNAQAHKSMAMGQSTEIATIRQFIANCAAEYLKRIKWVTDLYADPVRKQRLQEALVKYGWTDADIIGVVTPMQQAAESLMRAPCTSYAEIIAACDALLVAVDPPDSLWPE